MGSTKILVKELKLLVKQIVQDIKARWSKLKIQLVEQMNERADPVVVELIGRTFGPCGVREQFHPPRRKGVPAAGSALLLTPAARAVGGRPTAPRILRSPPSQNGLSPLVMSGA